MGSRRGRARRASYSRRCAGRASRPAPRRWPGDHRRRRRPTCPAHVPDLARRARRVRGHVGQRRDQERPAASPTSIPPIRSPTRRSPRCADRGEDDRWLISSFRIETIDRCRALGAGDPHGVVGRRGSRRRHRRRWSRSGHAALHPWVATLRTIAHRRLSRRRHRGQHLDVRRPGANGRTDRVGHRRHLHQRPRCGARGDRRRRSRLRSPTDDRASPRSGRARSAAPASRRGSRRRAGRGTAASIEVTSAAGQVGLHVDGGRGLHAAAAQGAAQRAEDGPDLHRT